jgi:ubiquinone/menaquinone biosynthesis C-methylase UbiE
MLSGLFILQVVFRVIRHWYHFPAPSIMTQFIDNPFRRRFIQSPDVVADRMELLPGMKVVEIGPGKGSYTLTFAQRVAPGGIVYACDIQQYVVDRLRERARRKGVQNVDARIDNAYAFSFTDNSMDRVIAPPAFSTQPA